MKPWSVGLLFLALPLWGGLPAPEPGAALKVWVSTQQDLAYFQKTTDAFLRLHPGLTVQFDVVPAVDARAKLETRGPAGQGPDLFMTPHDQLGDLRASGLIMPNLVFTPQKVQTYLDPVMDSLDFGGELMGFPLSVECLILFYNRDLYPQAPRTLENLVNQGRPLTSPKDGRYGFLFPVGDLYVVYPFLTVYGASLFGPKGTDPGTLGIDGPEAARGLGDLLVLKTLGLPYAGDATWEAVQSLFLSGRAGAILQGPWALKALKQAPFPLGMAPLPLVAGRRPQTFSGLMVLGVNSFSKAPRAAQLLAEFLTREENLVRRFELTGDIPPFKAFLNDPNRRKNPEVAPFLDQLAASRPMPRIKEMKLIWVPFAAALKDAWDGKLTPAEALREAGKTVRQQLSVQNG